jgi:hypothetical protein
MGHPAPTTSRRALLGALTAAPVAALVPVVSPWSDALASLHRRYGDDAPTLTRTEAGRRLSRARYHRAEDFFPDSGLHRHHDWHSFLYRAGITAQLGLSSHLLDVGFTDPWCARHIGLHVAKSLAYANATGFGHDCPDMARLAAVLTPYWKWNTPRSIEDPVPDDGGFTPEQVRPLLRALLDRVHQVTGHPRPHGWRRRRDRAEPSL